MPRFIFQYSLTYEGVFEVEASTLQEAEDGFNGTALAVLDRHVNKTTAEINYELSEETSEKEDEEDEEDKEAYLNHTTQKSSDAS